MLTVPLKQWARMDGRLHLRDRSEEEEVLDEASDKEVAQALNFKRLPALNEKASEHNPTLVLTKPRDQLYAILDLKQGGRLERGYTGRTVPAGFTEYVEGVEGYHHYRAPETLAGLKIPDVTGLLTFQTAPGNGTTNGLHIFGDRVRPMLEDYALMHQLASAELARTGAILASLCPTWMRFCAVEHHEPGLFGLRELPSGCHLAYDGAAWFGYLYYPQYRDYVGWVTWDNDLNFLQSGYCMMEAMTALHRTGRRQHYSLAGWAVGPGLNRAASGYGGTKTGPPRTKPRKYRPQPVNQAGETGPTDLYAVLAAELIGKLIACRYTLDKQGLPNKLDKPRYAKDIWEANDVPVHVSPKGTLLLYGDGIETKTVAMIHEDRAPIDVVLANYHFHYTLRTCFPDRFTDDDVAAIRNALTRCTPTPRNKDEEE